MPTGNMDVKPNRLIERVMAGYMGVVTKTCGLMPVEWPIAGKSGPLRYCKYLLWPSIILKSRNSFPQLVELADNLPAMHHC
jgi:hypothetical protein